MGNVIEKIYTGSTFCHNDGDSDGCANATNVHCTRIVCKFVPEVLHAGGAKWQNGQKSRFQLVYRTQEPQD